MRLIKQGYEILTPVSREVILKNIERFARVSHKSEGKIEDTVESASAFVSKILKLGHESILEHEKISVRLVTDRGVSHELVRHRLASYLQQSTRYCDSSDMEVVIPSWFPEVKNVSDVNDPSCLIWIEAMLQAEKHYGLLLSQGWTKDKARSVLPNSLKTEIVVTANLRELRHIFKLRTSSAAHEQIRTLLQPLQKELQQILPEIF